MVPWPLRWETQAYIREGPPPLRAEAQKYNKTIILTFHQFWSNSIKKQSILIKKQSNLIKKQPYLIKKHQAVNLVPHQIIHYQSFQE